jgi:DAHP synthetase I family
MNRVTVLVHHRLALIEVDRTAYRNSVAASPAPRYRGWLPWGQHGAHPRPRWWPPDSKTAPTATFRSQSTASKPRPRSFFGVDNFGRAAVVETAGNPDGHVILRSGSTGPNHDRASVAAAVAQSRAVGLPEHVMIDCSHANSGKDHIRPVELAAEVTARIAAGECGIAGLMLESFVVAASSITPANGPSCRRTDRLLWLAEESASARQHCRSRAGWSHRYPQLGSSEPQREIKTRAKANSASSMPAASTARISTVSPWTRPCCWPTTTRSRSARFGWCFSTHLLRSDGRPSERDGSHPI